MMLPSTATKIYSDVPTDTDDSASIIVTAEAVLVAAEDVEKGRLVPRIHKLEPMEVLRFAKELDGEWTTEQGNDFWVCFCVQVAYGPIGSGVVCCCNALRSNYPTRHAWNGCATGFLVAFALYLLIMFGLGHAADGGYRWVNVDIHA